MSKLCQMNAKIPSKLLVFWTDTGQENLGFVQMLSMKYEKKIQYMTVDKVCTNCGLGRTLDKVKMLHLQERSTKTITKPCLCVFLTGQLLSCLWADLADTLVDG